MKAKPKTTTMTPATMERRRWSWTRPAGGPRERAERDEDQREARR